MNGHKIFDQVTGVLKVLLLIMILRILLPSLGINIRIPLLDPAFAWVVRTMRAFATWITITLNNMGISI